MKTELILASFCGFAYTFITNEGELCPKSAAAVLGSVPFAINILAKVCLTIVSLKIYFNIFNYTSCSLGMQNRI